MTVEINTLGVNTPTATPEVVEAPEIGHVETTENVEVEHVETGTDKPDEFTPERYKNLQADYTKTKQEFSEFQKRYSKEAEELAAFRQMYAKEQTAQPQPPQQQGIYSKELSGKEFANLEPMEQLDYLIDRRVGKIVTPLQQENTALKQQLNYLVNEAANRTWNEFVAAHPDASNMGEQLSAVINKYGMPLNEAYKFIKADMAVPEAKQEVLKEIEAKKDAAKVMKPVATPTTPANTKVSSFEEAYEITKKQLGMK